MSQDPFERAVERIERSHQQELDGRARRRAQVFGRAFRIHAAVFVTTQLLLVTIWAVVAVVTGVLFPWFLFPLLAWGIGLAAHYAAIRPAPR